MRASQEKRQGLVKSACRACLASLSATLFGGSLDLDDLMSDSLVECSEFMQHWP
uniref:Uncharacterized protein n=1 Tax=Arundo donax TaxID=35708 RepID=A0A0A8YJ53_ARUDO